MMIITLVLISVINFCNTQNIFDLMDNIYNQSDKNIIKNIDKMEYMDSERHWNDTLKIEYKRSLDLHDQLDTLVWDPLITNKDCKEYWESKIGQYENFETMETIHYELTKILRFGYHNYLNGKPTKVDSLIEDMRFKLTQLDSSYNHNRTADTIDNIYIPKDYNDALEHMNYFFNEVSQKEFVQDDIKIAVGKAHLGRGLLLRNTWNIWGKSRLYYYFEAKGYSTPDNISSILLVGYYLKLSDQPHSFEDALNKYNETFDLE